MMLMNLLVARVSVHCTCAEQSREYPNDFRVEQPPTMELRMLAVTMFADCTMTMMQLRRRLPLMALIVSSLHHSYSFSIVSSIHATKRQTLMTCLHAANDNIDDNINLKEELTKYLDVRRQLRADEEAKA
jgi:hypothetical protein